MKIGMKQTTKTPRTPSGYEEHQERKAGGDPVFHSFPSLWTL
jgi:hypothetical protein